MKKIAFVLLFVLILSALAAFILNELSQELSTSARSGPRSAQQNAINAMDEARVRVTPMGPPQNQPRAVVPESMPEGNLFRLKHKIGEFARFLSIVIEKIRF
ncbi:hypothetical protein LJC31_04855 [Synergistaceae bacterium OttesenSCG-928-I11]|nr:hypothetical protein [Synergistaceae bacterium OttesenSCG-928-I11]